MPDQRATPAERLVASLITLPLGFGAALVDEFPTRVVRVREHMALARFVGRMMVGHGADELRRRVREMPEPAEPAAAPIEVDDTDAEEPADEHVPSGALALPDYDQLPAAHIVGKLAGLTDDERADIEAYEIAHRHRRTVLGKLDQLRSDSAS